MDGAAPAASFPAAGRPALAGICDDRAWRGMVDSHAGPGCQRANCLTGEESRSREVEKHTASSDTAVGRGARMTTLKDYGSYSFWLETSGDDLTPRPRLDGSIDVDVAFMGAGDTGLCAAYYLL